MSVLKSVLISAEDVASQVDCSGDMLAISGDRLLGDGVKLSSAQVMDP